MALVKRLSVCHEVRGGVLRTAVAATGFIAAVLTCARSANAVTTAWDPTGDRMASTDRSTATDIQPRIWLLTNGGGLQPGRFLVSRRPDLAQNGWNSVLGLFGLDTGLDAVSWPAGSTQKQRVFYVKDSGVYMLPFDNDTIGTPKLINLTALVQGYQVVNTDVAAVSFNVSGTRWMAVGAGATFGGQSGYFCVFESFDDGANWWNFCTNDRPLPPSNHDIVGVVLENAASPVPEFYFQNAFASLSRARRLGPNSWIMHEELPTPNGLIGASLVATPAPQTNFPGKYSLAVISSDNKVYTSRIAPTGTPTWTARAALPTGVTPFASKTALGGISCSGTGAAERERLYVVGSNLGLYQLSTTDAAGTWQTSWAGPHFSPSGYVATIGTITKETSGSSFHPRVFGAVGYPTYTLQEFASATTKFKDYIKYQPYPLALPNSGIAVSETSSQADNSLALMTGIDRNFSSATSPWKIRLRSSTDGGNSYDTSDSVITSFGGSSWFVTDPIAVVRPGMLHHSVNDVQFPANGCHHTIGVGDNAIASKISYRRGTSAGAIAALTTPGPNAMLVDLASNDGLDHPWMVATPDGAVHVTYSGGTTANSCGSAGVCYWRLPASGSAQRTPIVPLSGAPRAVRGANNEIYAFPDGGDGWSKICTLKNAFGTGVVEADCTRLGKCTPGTSHCDANGAMTPAPSGASSLVNVGPEISAYAVPAEAECQPQAGKKYRCFRAYALRAVAADPTTNYRVHVAYLAGAAGTPGLYYTRSAGGEDRRPRPAGCGRRVP